MKELEHAYNLRVQSHPNLSSFICFSRAVAETKPSLRVAMLGLSKLVDKQDYSKSDLKQIRFFLNQKIAQKKPYF